MALADYYIWLIIAKPRFGASKSEKLTRLAASVLIWQRVDSQCFFSLRAPNVVFVAFFVR